MISARCMIAYVALLFFIGCMPEQNAPDSGSYLSLDSADIYYEVHGDGTPVLLLHGGFSSAKVWRKQIEVLAEYYQVIAMDSRAHGRSTGAEGPLSYEQLASDAVSLLDFLGVEKAHVVGWSDGGVAGLHMALSYPQYLGRLITIGVTVQGPGSLDQLSGLMYEDRRLFNFLMGFLFQREYNNINPQPDWFLFRDNMFAMWTQPCYFKLQEGEACLDPLSRVLHPVLLMAGSKEMVREEHTRAIYQHLPDAQLLTIPGGTHYVFEEQPAVVNAAILRFLGS